jgi:hypothetical protein
VERPDLPRGAWWWPAILWAFGFVVVGMVGFGAGTSCTNSRPEAECSAIDDWASFGVIAAGLVAAMPVSRSVREQARPTWISATVGVIVSVTVIAVFVV